MASTFNCLYSTGPNAVGPGTWVAQSLFNPRKNRGVITRMYQDTNGIAPTALSGLYTLSDSFFPGTSIPLNYTYVKQLDNINALVISNYGSSSGSNGYRRVMTRTPSGYRQVPFWNVSSAYTEQRKNYVGDPSNQQLRPEYTLTIPTKVIRWSSVVYSDSRPNDNTSLVGKVNSNSYTIDGYSHATETLLFEGTQIAHDKWGGSDRWTIYHSVTHDPVFKHREPDTLDVGARRDNGTWNFTLSDGGEGLQRYATTSFPNLP